jgi:hypothetical protein
MGVIKRDNNELRYNSLWLLPKQMNPDYYGNLFKNAKAFFYGMNRYDLVEDMDFIINEKIEKVMGCPISLVLITYKNLPALNSFTRSKHPLYATMNIYKYTIQGWLDEIEGWIFREAQKLEGEIRFTIPAKQFV